MNPGFCTKNQFRVWAAWKEAQESSYGTVHVYRAKGGHLYQSTQDLNAMRLFSFNKGDREPFSVAWSQEKNDEHLVPG